MTTTANGAKFAVKIGDRDIAEALVAAGLMNEGAVEAAEDSAIEDAVGSENLAAVRLAFPAAQ
jgi:hypothetical protein